MKLIVFLAAVVALGLMVATGTVSFRYSFSSSPSTPLPDEPRSQTVREVFAVLDAATPDAADLDNAQIVALVERIETDRDRASTRLLERELPSLALRLDRKVGRFSARVAASSVETRVGRKCRAATLRLLDRQRHTLRALAQGIARRGATVAAVDRFGAGWRRISVWYASQLRACAAGAAPADRAAIEAAID